MWYLTLSNDNFIFSRPPKRRHALFNCPFQSIVCNLSSEKSDNVITTHHCKLCGKLCWLELRAIPQNTQQPVVWNNMISLPNERLLMTKDISKVKCTACHRHHVALCYLPRAVKENSDRNPLLPCGCHGNGRS